MEVNTEMEVQPWSESWSKTLSISGRERWNENGSTSENESGIKVGCDCRREYIC